MLTLESLKVAAVPAAVASPHSADLSAVPTATGTKSRAAKSQNGAAALFSAAAAPSADSGVDSSKQEANKAADLSRLLSVADAFR